MSLATALTLAAGAAPAAADRPETATEVMTFVEPDPCDPGTLMTTTLEMEFATHEHDRTYVEKNVTTVTTSTGYVGRERTQVVATGEVFKVSLQAMVSNPDTDDRYKVSFVLVLDSDGLRADRYSMTCLRGGD